MSISIDGSGSISGVSSLSNPSNIVVGTGVSIVSPSANELSIRTNGADRIRVGAGGSVGIGTDNPDSKLHIRDLDSTITLEGTRGSGHKYRIETTGTDAEGINIYDNAANQRAWLYYAGADSSTDSYHTFNTNGIERVRIDSSGRVTMPYQPACDAYGSGTCTVSDGTSQDIPITTFFSNRGFSIVSNKLVVPKSGYYHLTTSYISQITGSGYSIRAIHIFPLINGVDIVSSYYDSRWNSAPTAGFSNTHYEISHSWILSLTENDQIDLRVVIYHNKGTTLNDPYRASIFAHLLG